MVWFEALSASELPDSANGHTGITSGLSPESVPPFGMVIGLFGNLMP